MSDPIQSLEKRQELEELAALEGLEGQESLQLSEPETPASERSLLALIATLFLPGLGHALRGHARRGIYFLLALLSLWLVFTVLSAWWMVALPAVVIATFAWLAACAFDAYRLPKKEQATKMWFIFAAVCGFTWLIAPVAMSATVRAVSVEAFKVPSAAMCPTLQVGDQMFVDKTAYRGGSPARGDIVVYEGRQNMAFVHRVVAVAGQEVEVDPKGRVTVNGEAAKVEPAKEPACQSALAHSEVLGTTHGIVLGPGDGLTAKLRVPEGHVFVLGDNRPNSADSRSVGTISTDSILGRPYRRYMRDGAVSFAKIE